MKTRFDEVKNQISFDDSLQDDDMKTAVKNRTDSMRTPVKNRISFNDSHHDADISLSTPLKALKEAVKLVIIEQSF